MQTLVLKLGKEREDALSGLEVLKFKNSELEKVLFFLKIFCCYNRKKTSPDGL
jgi:hypothetical protein